MGSGKGKFSNRAIKGVEIDKGDKGVERPSLE